MHGLKIRGYTTVSKEDLADDGFPDSVVDNMWNVPTCANVHQNRNALKRQPRPKMQFEVGSDEGIK